MMGESLTPSRRSVRGMRLGELTEVDTGHREGDYLG
jgi:hypothetical protein